MPVGATRWPNCAGTARLVLRNAATKALAWIARAVSAGRGDPGGGRPGAYT